MPKFKINTIVDFEKNYTITANDKYEAHKLIKSKIKSEREEITDKDFDITIDSTQIIEKADIIIKISKDWSIKAQNVPQGYDVIYDGQSNLMKKK